MLRGSGLPSHISALIQTRSSNYAKEITIKHHFEQISGCLVVVGLEHTTFWSLEQNHETHVHVLLGLVCPLTMNTYEVLLKRRVLFYLSDCLTLN